MKAINVVAPISLAGNLLLVITPFYKALSDRYGRRLFLMINTVGMGIGMLIVFILACRIGWGPIVAGIAYGCSIGGLWSMSDTLILTMPAESSPSGMRSSVMGTISVLIGSGMFVGNIIFIISQNFLPMDILFTLICLPFMALSLIIVMTKVRETKDVDLDKVTADTFK